MRKFLVPAIPILTLTLFVLIMLSGNILKKPFGDNDDIPKSIQTIMQDVQNEKWEIAITRTDQLSISWKRIVNRVQFSSERDEINALSFNIARLRGAVMARDKSGALMELNEAYEHWVQLGK